MNPSPDLATLPPEHPLRNTPLNAIGGQMRNRQGKLWRDVATWKIGRSSFNQLAPVWTENNEFQANAN